MKTIIVPTDFSATAMNAADYAAEMALAIDAKILLIHAYQVPVTYTEIPVSMDYDSLLQVVEKDLANAKEQLLTRHGKKLGIETEMRIGNFFYELRTVCERVDPYAVIMGSQGTSAADRLLFGSHAVYAMKNLTWPLVTVPPDARFSFVKNIGLACDFENITRTVPIDELSKLVNDFNAALHILNIGTKERFNPDIGFGSALISKLLGSIKPVYHLLEGDDIDKGIMNFAEKNQIDLLVVLPKRHSLLDKITHKSHTRQFVLHSHVPVMALHQ